MKNTTQRTHWLLSCLLIAALLAAACQSTPAPQPTPAPTTAPVPGPTLPPTDEPAAETPTSTEVAEETPEATATPAAVAEAGVHFATFQEPAVQAVPAVKQETIQPDLANVRVAFALSNEQRARLAKDGVVASLGAEKEFFTVYEKTRYANVPAFVTSDSLLHVYHLLFDKTLRTAETQYFVPLLRDLNAALLERADAEHEALAGQNPEWEAAAVRTVAFVGVAAKLLDPSVEVPAYARELADAELALIDQAAGIQPSPIFPDLPLGEDYTQYIPRGHYTKSDELKAYFKSMMWYGRMTFRLKTDDPEVGRAETRAALLLAQALRSAQVGYRPALEVWADLYNPTAFFVGRSDDLTVLQYLDVMDQVYGADAGATAVAAAGDKLDQFIAAAIELPPPRILGMVIYDTQDVEKTTTGMRLMGQRFVPDAYIFRQLIYRNVGTAENPRGLPKGLDLLAAMGSERAYQILDQAGDTKYENYVKQMDKVRGWLSGLTTAEWTETLYNTWLYSFQPLLAVPGAGTPAFMQSPAWVDKQLHTVLGSWTELKHDTILYAKQVYAEAGAGPPPPEPVPPQGYVEPVPVFFARLAALTAMTREGLDSRGLLNDTDAAGLQRLEELAGAFQTMAEKELRGEALSEEEYTTILYYGRDLEHLTIAAADQEAGSEPGGTPTMDEEPQAAVIADVATNPINPAAPVVLEEAVGRVDEIHVVVPMVDADGSTYLQVAKGAIFSYYEFEWPASDRLTDEKWRQMLDEAKAPAKPDWTQSFYTDKGEQSDLTEAVFNLQQSIISAAWYLEPGYVQAKDTAAVALKAGIKQLQDRGLYEGCHLLRSEFRSFDRQSATKAVVTVRETWQDALYELKDYPGMGGDPIKERGPYTLDVTYTLEKAEYGWQVSKILYATQPPEW